MRPGQPTSGGSWSRPVAITAAVAELHQLGMSARAIARALGISDRVAAAALATRR